MPAVADPSTPRAWVRSVLEHAVECSSPPIERFRAGPFELSRPAADREGAGELDPQSLQASDVGCAAPRLSVALFDTAVTSIPAPVVQERVRLSYDDGAVRAVLGADQLAWVLDLDRRLGCRVALGAAVPAWEQAAPLRPLLTWWAGAHGLALVHAAAVSFEGQGLLLAGPPGAGKSTFALACGASGWPVLGDDYCIVEPGPPARVHPLYANAKADRASEQLVGLSPAHRTGLTVAGKQVVSLNAFGHPAASVSISAICVLEPRRVDAAPSVRALRSVDAAQALAPGTLAQQVGGWDDTWRVIAGVARTIPVLGVQTGSTPLGAVEVLAGALRAGHHGVPSP